jgi:RNA polymerase sigma-70 factor (ECF subfamily)
MCRTDEQCVRECLGDHPETFRHLVERHQGPLLRYLRGRLGSEDEAAEAAQETFVRAYFALRKLKNPGAFFSWLLGIANRVAKESHRGKEQRRRIVSLNSEPADTADEQDDSPDYSVTQAVSELPDVYRQVVLLRFYAGLSCAEISRDLDMPLGTVTKRLSRAYSLLRESLQEQNQQEDVEAQP